jgi:CHAD domain-containing protein
MSQFRIERDESPGEALPRILGWCVDAAAEEIARGHAGAHEARKRLREARSCLALGRVSLGTERDRLEEPLRNAAHRLAPVRDADALVELIDELGDDPIDGLQPSHLRALHAAALAHRALLRAGLAVELDNAGREVAAARELLSELSPTGGWKRLLSGHARELRRACAAWRRAERTRDDDDLHSWRKRLKVARHQVEILSPALEPVLEGWADAYHKASDLLGRHRDLGTLRDLAQPLPQAKAMRAVLVHERERLVKKALELGERLHAVDPDEQAGAIAGWLRSWQKD